MRRLLFGMLVLAAASCGRDDVAQTSEVELPSQVVENFQMHESSTGKKRYSLTGSKAFFYDGRSEIVVLEPHILFYGARREVTSEVVCDSGVVSNRTGDLAAYGHVVVTTEDSTVLYTDSLVWHNRRARIETDAEVLITSSQGVVQGKGLISDADLRRIEIKEEVTGTTGFSIEEEE